MTIGGEEAADALAAVHASQRQAGELRRYASAGYVLIGWGLAWLAIYLTAQFAPQWSHVVAPLATVSAVGWSIIGTRGKGKSDARTGATIGAALGYAALVAAITGATPRMQMALVALLVAASYVTLGIWTGWRFALLGLIVAGAVVLGWFVFPAWLYLWLGLAGGGTLLLGGVWLGRA